jgi:hypothetical protein
MVYLSEPVLKKKMRLALETTYRAFGLETPPYMLTLLAEDIASHDTFDFGRLDEELQTGIIQTVAANPSALKDLADINPFLRRLPGWTEETELIHYNREKVLQGYGKEKIAAGLKETYGKVLQNSLVHKLSRNLLLELYLNPLKLSLVGISHD